jgi:hypothetical protein
MLEHPVDPPVLAAMVAAVTNREVRAISRKGRDREHFLRDPGIPRGYTPDSL